VPKYKDPSPAISGKQLALLSTAGHPAANTSSTGKPNPSYNEGKINAAASHEDSVA
jgi:hypothetical protein